jgi:hypothetical protein
MSYFKVIGVVAVAGVFAALGPAMAGPGKHGSPGIDAGALETACATAAKSQPSAVRPGKKTKMWCAVDDP